MIPDFEGRVCFGRNYLVFESERCNPSEGDTFAVAVSFRDRNGNPLPEQLAVGDWLRRAPIGKDCGFFLWNTPNEFASVTLEGRSLTAAPLWTASFSGSTLMRYSE